VHAHVHKSVIAVRSDGAVIAHPKIHLPPHIARLLRFVRPFHRRWKARRTLLESLATDMAQHSSIHPRAINQRISALGTSRHRRYDGIGAIGSPTTAHKTAGHLAMLLSSPCSSPVLHKEKQAWRCLH